MWFFLVLPRTAPELEMTTAVFHSTSPCSPSRSSMGDTTTMLCFFASWEDERRAESDFPVNGRGFLLNISVLRPITGLARGRHWALGGRDARAA